MSIVRLTKCHVIHLGDISAALDIAFIRQESIVTVVTAAVGLDHVSYDQNVHHIVYPLLDMKSENISKYFSQFYDLMEKELQRGNVLIHCAAGISRSSTLVIAYLMKKQCWGFREAISFVRKTRASVCPNLGFERQLKEYEIFLNKQAENGYERRFGSKTSEERKHLASPYKEKVLPDILMARTQLRPKIIDLFTAEPENRFSQQRSHKLSQEKGREQFEFYGTKRVTFKPKKSKSITERPVQRPFNLSPLVQDSEHLEKLKGSLPLQRLQGLMMNRLNPGSKKTATERQIRVKPLHKLAYY